MRLKGTNDMNFMSSLIMNEMDFTSYLNTFINIAVSRYKWDGFPASIDTRFLEYWLNINGNMLCFRDDVLEKMLVSRSTNGGAIGFYDEPIERWAYASNGYKNRLTQRNSVIIWNNLNRTPSYPFLENQAMRLWDLDRTVDVNAHAQKTPLLIRCEESVRLSLKNLMARWLGNQHLIFADKMLNTDDIQVLKTDAPFVADKIQTLKESIWNETMTYLGVSNVRFEKSERMVSDEVVRAMGGTIACRDSYTQAREIACDKINKMFGINGNVTFNERNLEYGTIHTDCTGDMRNANRIKTSSNEQ